MDCPNYNPAAFFIFHLFDLLTSIDSEKLADRIRKALAHHPKVEENKIFRGIAYMLSDKMCMSDPALQETAVGKSTFRKMIVKAREYKGYGCMGQEGIRSKKDFD